MEVDTPFTRGKYTSEIIRIFMFLFLNATIASVLQRRDRLKTHTGQRVKSH
jgi:hypothetical protein